MHNLFALMASYNAWMNTKVYATASELSPEQLVADKGAFFGSVLGTLNHLVVADRIWLQRFAEHPARPTALQWVRHLPKPASLDEILFEDLTDMRDHRTKLDTAITDWAGTLTEADLDQVLQYSTLKGAVVAERFSSLVLHFFNHQTHHRGQVTTLLSQFGKDVGVTDLLALIQNRTKA